eukprot:TRINITY_DN1122_c0_g1_i1.p1 TRINITY_DN1122_c0_g1~~TRINITY_DN1122_c0_g1_i1.p1  ORF type:complete len:229 (+),score=73.66 TRINITY_DN1122_c0_g1_i1:143-829(+)
MDKQEYEGPYTSGEFVEQGHPPQGTDSVHVMEVQKQHHRGRRCLYCFCGFMVALIVIVGICLLILWLTIKPKAPEFTVTDLSFNSFNIGQAVVNGSEDVTLNGDLELDLMAKNPNKVSLMYKSVNSSAYYHGLYIASAVLSKFEQPAHSTEKLQVPVKFQNVPIGQFGTELLADFTQRSILLQIITHVLASVKFWGITTPSVKVVITCDLNFDPIAMMLVNKTCAAKL